MLVRAAVPPRCQLSRLTVYARGRARTKPGRQCNVVQVVQVVVHTKDRPAAVGGGGVGGGGGGAGGVVVLKVLAHGGCGSSVLWAVKQTCSEYTDVC